jgi:hypothetical protein
LKADRDFMLRLAACFTCEAGILLDATIHDALLIEAAACEIDAAVEAARGMMDRASELVLYGFKLRTDFEVIRWPNRYQDERGAVFFQELLDRLAVRQRSYRRREEVGSSLHETSSHVW